MIGKTMAERDRIRRDIRSGVPAPTSTAAMSAAEAKRQRKMQRRRQ